MRRKSKNNEKVVSVVGVVSYEKKLFLFTTVEGYIVTEITYDKVKEQIGKIPVTWECSPT